MFSKTAIPPVAADVFEYFAHLPTESVNELLAAMDTPENVFMVHPEWYTRFHRLDWCFVPIGMVNRFTASALPRD